MGRAIKSLFWTLFGVVPYYEADIVVTNLMGEDKGGTV